MKYRQRNLLSEDEKSITRSIWGCVMGSILLYATFWEVLPLLNADGSIDKTDWVGLSGMVILSFAASMPWLFMSILGDLVAGVKRRIGGE